jgi:hypothetical protein
MVNNFRKVQFEYLEFLFKGMFSVKSKYYPDSTFFKRDDKVILELEKSGTLWVLYSVWTNISDMFSYDYGNTQQLIKEWVEAQLKKELVAPLRASGAFLLRTAIVEEKFKSGVVVPEGFLDGGFTQVEKQLKQEEITPLQGCVSQFSMDVEELTPQQMNYVIIGDIEEESKSAEVTPKNAIAPPSSWRNLKSAEVIPDSLFLFSGSDMEEELKSQEITPVGRWLGLSYETEEELKSAEIKPVKDVNLICQLAELRLNREEITPKEAIPRQIWRDLEKEEVTPRSAIAPPFRWRKLDSVKYVEIKPNVPLSTYHLKAVEEQLKSEEITPRQVVSASFDWIQEQINLGEITPQVNYKQCFVLVGEQLNYEEQTKKI